MDIPNIDYFTSILASNHTLPNIKILFCVIEPKPMRCNIALKNIINVEASSVFEIIQAKSCSLSMPLLTESQMSSNIWSMLTPSSNMLAISSCNFLLQSKKDNLNDDCNVSVNCYTVTFLINMCCNTDLMCCALTPNFS